MAILNLIRHSEPTIRGVFLGRMDSPLSAAGHQQASDTLRTIDVRAVYHSPLLRAKETAAYIPSTNQVEVVDLREMDYGLWTGKTWQEIQAHWSELAAVKTNDWLGIPAPGGETWNDLLTRIKPVWRSIRTGPTPAAVVAHQAVNAALVSLIDGRNPLEFFQQYGELIRVEFD